MNIVTRLLLTTGLGGVMLGMPRGAVALGGGGEGAHIPAETVNITGIGPLSGT